MQKVGKPIILFVWKSLSEEAYLIQIEVVLTKDHSIENIGGRGTF